MARSLSKGPYVAHHLLEKIKRLNAAGEKKVIKTWARSSMITPDFIDHTFAVHNGKKHINVLVTQDMVGDKLGEYAPTRTFRGHKTKK